MPSKLSGEGEQPEPQLWGRRKAALRGAMTGALAPGCGVWAAPPRACRWRSQGGPPVLIRGREAGPQLPLELLDCSFFSPHFSRSVLFWNGTVLSFPGTPAPPYGVLEDSLAFSKVILSFMVH